MEILKFRGVDDGIGVPGENRPGLLERLSEEKRNLTTRGAENRKAHDVDKTQRECHFVWTLKQPDSSREGIGCGCRAGEEGEQGVGGWGASLVCTVLATQEI